MRTLLSHNINLLNNSRIETLSTKSIQFSLNLHRNSNKGQAIMEEGEAFRLSVGKVYV
jgi:hypothetical protein